MFPFFCLKCFINSLKYIPFPHRSQTYHIHTHTVTHTHTHTNTLLHKHTHTSAITHKHQNTKRYTCIYAQKLSLQEKFSSAGLHFMTLKQTATKTRIICMHVLNLTSENKITINQNTIVSSRYTEREKNSMHTHNNNNNEHISRAPFHVKLSMLNCAEQVHIQKYKTHAYKTLKTAGVQIIMLKHPTKHKKGIPIKPKYCINVLKNNPNHTN